PCAYLPLPLRASPAPWSSRRVRYAASCGPILAEDGLLPPLACSPASPPLRPRPPGRRVPAPRRGGRVSRFFREDLDGHALAFLGPGRPGRAGGLACARVRARHGGPAVLPPRAHHRPSLPPPPALPPHPAPPHTAPPPPG